MLRTPRVRSSRCRRLLRRIRLNPIHGPFPLERGCERQAGFREANRVGQPRASRWTFTSALQAAVHCTSAALRHPGSACCRSPLEAPDCPTLVNLVAPQETQSGSERTRYTQDNTEHNARAAVAPAKRFGLSAAYGLAPAKPGDQPMTTQDHTEQDARNREQGEPLAFTSFAQACRGHGWPARRKTSPASPPPRVAPACRPR